MTCPPGMCASHPACGDLLCPGRPVTLHRVPGLHIDNGGHRISGADSFRLHAADPKGDEPITTPSQAQGWAAQFYIAAVGLACLAAGAIAYLFR